MASFLGLPRWAGTRKVNQSGFYWTDSEWQWHQLGHMQVYTLIQTDNQTSTPPLSFYRTSALPATQPIASKHWRHYGMMYTFQVNPNYSHKIRDFYPVRAQSQNTELDGGKSNEWENKNICVTQPEPCYPIRWCWSLISKHSLLFLNSLPTYAVNTHVLSNGNFITLRRVAPVLTVAHSRQTRHSTTTPYHSRTTWVCG